MCAPKLEETIGGWAKRSGRSASVELAEAQGLVDHVGAPSIGATNSQAVQGNESAS